MCAGSPGAASAALGLALVALDEGMARSRCFGSKKVERGTCCSHTLTNNVRRTVEAGMATQAAGGTSSAGAPCSKRPARTQSHAHQRVRFPSRNPERAIRHRGHTQRGPNEVREACVYVPSNTRCLPKTGSDTWPPVMGPNSACSSPACHAAESYSVTVRLSSTTVGAPPSLHHQTRLLVRSQ